MTHRTTAPFWAHCSTRDFSAWQYDGSIAQTVAVHWHQTRRLMSVYLRQTMSFRSVWAEHQAILIAIVRGDAKTAERLSREHADNACQTMLRLLFRQDEAIEGRTTDPRSLDRIA